MEKKILSWLNQVEISGPVGPESFSARLMKTNVSMIAQQLLKYQLLREIDEPLPPGVLLSTASPLSIRRKYSDGFGLSKISLLLKSLPSALVDQNTLD